MLRMYRLAVVALALAAICAVGARADYVYTPATAHDSSPNDFFTFGTPVTTFVSSGGAYDGIATVVTALDSGLTSFEGTQAVLRGGAAPADTTVSMAWRNRTDLERDGMAYGGVYWPEEGITQYAIDGIGTGGRGVALAYDAYDVWSDVLDLQGVSGIYVLEMTYSEDVILYRDGVQYDEAYVDGLNKIYLGYFETDGSGLLPDYDEWVNAVDGNSTTGALAVEWYKGSFDAFLAEILASDPTFDVNDPADLAPYLGSFGSDIVGNTTWAILDHNSEFGVVPEPATMGLVGLGLVFLIHRSRRR